MFLLTFLKLSIRLRICIQNTDSYPCHSTEYLSIYTDWVLWIRPSTLLLCTVNKILYSFSGMYACATVPFHIFPLIPSFYCISPSKSSQTEPVLHLVYYTVSHPKLVLSFLSFYDLSFILSLLNKCLNRVQ